MESLPDGLGTQTGSPSCHSVHPLRKDGVAVSSGAALRSESDIVGDPDVYAVDVGFALGVVQLDDHLHHLSRAVAVLLKGHAGCCDTLANAAATGDLSVGLSGL